MPSDPAPATGRCYCGAVTLTAMRPPETVAYCHCRDCRRWTGGAMGTFAAFATEALIQPSGPIRWFSVAQGVERSNCTVCGSPIAATFDYLAGQIYVPVGILDQVDNWPPALHCHAGSAVRWLHLDDDLPRVADSGRDSLLSSGRDHDKRDT